MVLPRDMDVCRKPHEPRSASSAPARPRIG